MVCTLYRFDFMQSRSPGTNDLVCGCGELAGLESFETCSPIIKNNIIINNIVGISGSIPGCGGGISSSDFTFPVIKNNKIHSNLILPDLILPDLHYLSPIATIFDFFLSPVSGKGKDQGFFNTNQVDEKIARDKKSLRLIKEYPDVFSNFYSMKYKYLPDNLCYEIQDILGKLIIYFPKTLSVVMTEIKINLIQILSMIRKFSARYRRNNYIHMINLKFPDIVEVIYSERNRPLDPAIRYCCTDNEI